MVTEADSPDPERTCSLLLSDICLGAAFVFVLHLPRVFALGDIRPADLCATLGLLTSSWGLGH